MGSSTGHVLTLANSIIGVSVLAMPFCFKKCGILLSIVLLWFSSLITKLACHYLIKSAIMERIRNFEMLAFRAFGATGKAMVEFCIIGFMLGTCAAFFVIIGDLGPAIIAPLLGIDHMNSLRPSVLIGVAVFIILPLGLLHNVDSLSSVCAASIAFYTCLVLKVMTEAGHNLITGDWLGEVVWWRPAGVIQCIPIFSMALSCQTQLFEVFDSLPNTQIERTNSVVKLAINLTTIFYIAVGFFGYAAYCNQAFSGNLMMNFSPTLASDFIKIGFLMSIAVSFPLVIFPCRASIYSMLYSKVQHGYEGLSPQNIPQTTFQCITLGIVTVSLVFGLLIPNIEVVLGLVGSTIGVFVCVIVPGMIFNNLATRNNNEKLVAQLLVGVGLIIMILGTYANLFATEEAISGQDTRQQVKNVFNKINLNNQQEIIKAIEKVPYLEKIEKESKKMPETKNKKSKVKNDFRSKPVIPVEPVKVQKEAEQQPAVPEPPAEPKKVEVEVVKQPEAPKEKEDPKLSAPEPDKSDKVLKEVLPVSKSVEKPIINESKKQEIVVKPEEKKIGPEPLTDNKLTNEVKEEEANIDLKQKINVKENLTISMAKGLPLPIAVKALEKNEPLKLEREKRDLEVENCEKNDTKIINEGLIKSPSRLSDHSHPVLDLKPEPAELKQDSVPHKRDLKSIDNES